MRMCMCSPLARAQDTFQRAKQWVKELQRQGNPNIVIALAGNKSDLNSKRKVEPEVRVARAACRVDEYGVALAPLAHARAERSCACHGR